MSLGERIREARISKDLRLSDVARRTGFTGGYISQVERDLASPSINALRKICQAVGTSPDIVLTEGKASPRGSASGEEPIGIVRRDRRKVMIYPGSEIGTSYYLPI